ncbi:MAG TPA: glycosyltransferase [Chloroflexia bacterium]|nr:glycosyltransferase [Chloroflexia bacterium]
MLVSEAPPIKSGIARVAGELTERLRARGITIDVLSANEIPRWTFGEFRFSSLALHWPRIQRKLADYDILHIHGTVPTFSDIALPLGRLGLKLARPSTAIVYTHHSDIDIAGLEVPAGIYNRLHSRLLGLADHVVASTPTYATMLENSPMATRVSAVRFGVEAEEFHTGSNKPDRFNVLFVGQLRPYKAVDVLLRAWQRVDNADLHIVGDGHQRAELEALAKRLNLKSVHFHGSVSEKQLKEAYAQAHALVLPSNRKAEAFGLVLLEGMAAGCVPISSDLPGVSDVVGTSGFTFPVGDSDALADILLKLRDDTRLRNDLSVLAVARSMATDWDYTAEAYHGIYRQAYLGKQLSLLLSKKIHPAPLQRWLRSVAHEAGADRASIMLRVPGTHTLRIAASIGLSPHVVNDSEVQVGQRISGFVAHTGRSMLISRRNMPAVARLFRQKGSDLTSSLVLPVCDGNEVVGVINLSRGPGRVAFTEADRTWVGRLAEQVAPLLAGQRERNAEQSHSPSPSRPAVGTAQPAVSPTMMRRVGAVGAHAAEKAAMPTKVASEADAAGVGA